jgi:branched-chain amino acid transport system ATP-binding protein
VLEAGGVSAGYQGQAVVRDIDLKVDEGEIVALLGPNGAGKTTTLLALAGELPCLAGSVRLFGQTSREPLFRRVRGGLGFISDDRPVVMGLSVRDNLRLKRNCLDAGLALFPELATHLDRPVALLSGGQQQMVAMARALALGPKILLADELSFGLAPMVVNRLFDALVAAAGNGVGVLLVEQQVTHVLEIAHRAFVLRNGRTAVAHQSPPQTISGGHDDLWEEGLDHRGYRAGGPPHRGGPRDIQRGLVRRALRGRPREVGSGGTGHDHGKVGHGRR